MKKKIELLIKLKIILKKIDKIVNKWSVLKKNLKIYDKIAKHREATRAIRWFRLHLASMNGLDAFSLQT